MDVIINGRFVDVGKNPNWCNNLGDICSTPCEEKDQKAIARNNRCKYFRIYMPGHDNYKWTNTDEQLWLENCGSNHHTVLNSYPSDGWLCLTLYPEAQKYRTKWDGLSKEIALADHKREMNKRGYNNGE